MNKENLLINKFKNNFIGDDAAIVDNFSYSKDLFCEDVHFKRSWLSMSEIGYKAMIINISDAIAMNSFAKYALLGLALPKNISMREISELHKGIKKACDEYNVLIIGGDSISNDKISISVSIIGQVNKKAIKRSGAKNGDYLAFSGNLGSSLKALRTLCRGGKISSDSKFKKPILRDKFMYKTYKFINSAMDISDGLYSDIAKICNASKLKLKKIKNFDKNIMKSGEEYELLFSFSPKFLSRIKSEAKKQRIKINILGKLQRGREKSYAKQHF